MANAKKTPAKKSTKKSKAIAPAVLPAKLQKILDNLNGEGDGEDESEVEGGGKIANILYLHSKGFSKKQIVDAGYNKSTVYRQVGHLVKMQSAPALDYYGYDLFEAKVQRYAKSKGITRDAAYKLMMKKLDDATENE